MTSDGKKNCSYPYSPEFRIDRSGIRLNSKLFAQTVVRRAVIMWRELVKRANPSYVFQEDEDRTRCNRHVRQRSLSQHALDANTWAGGGCLDYFAHGSANLLTEALLSQTSQNVRIGDFVPLFFFVHCPLPDRTRQRCAQQTSSYCRLNRTMDAGFRARSKGPGFLTCRRHKAPATTLAKKNGHLDYA